MVVAGVDIERSKIPELYPDDYDEYVKIWKTWRALGVLPFGGGWAEQPAHVTESILLFEEMYNLYLKEEQGNG